MKPKFDGALIRRTEAGVSGTFEGYAHSAARSMQARDRTLLQRTTAALTENNVFGIDSASATGKGVA